MLGDAMSTRDCRNDNNGKKKKFNKIFNKNMISNTPFLGSSHFEINGNNEVIVDGCRAIVEYDESSIKIDMGKMLVLFLGTDLTIKCLTIDSLVIEGIILSIEFIT